MRKETGNYAIKYTTGVTVNMGMTYESEAIIKAREDGKRDPNLLLFEITDLGGCVISWKVKNPYQWFKKLFLRICGVVYQKFHRLVAIGQSFS